MPVRPCPTCAQPTAPSLDTAIAVASLRYYRCAYCGHVWHTPKDNPDAEPTTVMPGRVQDTPDG
jgi:hypothetical protein